MEETVKIFGLSSNIQILFSDLNYYRCLGSNSLLWALSQQWRLLSPIGP